MAYVTARTSINIGRFADATAGLVPDGWPTFFAERAWKKEEGGGMVVVWTGLDWTGDEVMWRDVVWGGVVMHGD
jgi:hypothetical protein